MATPLEEQEPETRGKRRPEGTIRVYDDYAGTFVPVKGVKIRCHRFIKWSTTFTDESGHYTMDSKFRFGPHYAIVFDNRKGFDIWGNWGPIARANLNMGWHSNRGHSRDINAGSFAWDWAAVNQPTITIKCAKKQELPNRPVILKFGFSNAGRHPLSLIHI